jgi:hypothetical protein
VANESLSNDSRVTKELIANCYSATIPEEDFDLRLREVLSKTNPDKIHEIYRNAFVVQSIRQVALSQTAGFSALIKTLNTAELLAEAEQIRTKEINKAKAEERHAVLEQIKIKQGGERQQKAELVAGLLTKVILAMLCILCVGYIIHDYGLLGKPPLSRSLFAEVVLAGAAVYGILDVFGTIPAASVRAALQRQLLRLVFWLQHQLV